MVLFSVINFFNCCIVVSGCVVACMVSVSTVWVETFDFIALFDDVGGIIKLVLNVPCSVDAVDE